MTPLTNLCCELIAKYINSLEDLKYVPEHLGQMIFEFCLKHKTVDITSFRRPEIRPISLFLKEYKESMITSFKPPKEIINLVFPSFPHLNIVSLDLSRCLSSANIHILTYVSQIEQLQFLSLRYNNLIDDNIRDLTAKWRFYRCGELVEIDLSGNPFLSENICSYLITISSLERIIVNDTGMVDCVRSIFNWKVELFIDSLLADAVQIYQEYLQRIHWWTNLGKKLWDFQWRMDKINAVQFEWNGKIGDIWRLFDFGSNVIVDRFCWIYLRAFCYICVSFRP